MAFTYTNAPVLSKVKIGEQYYYLKDADVRAILNAINANVYEKLKLDLGAGKTDIDNLIVSKDAFINTGAGKFQVLAGSINNLDFDIGVGEANIKTKLTGVNRFDAGVGALKLNLLGNLDDYRIKVSKGIGNISIDSKNVSEGEIGNGDVIVDIDGGIGEIKVDFNE